MYMASSEEVIFEKIYRRRGVCSKRRNELADRRGEAKLRSGSEGCRKISYASKADAQGHMSQINSKGLPNQLRNSYRCPHCQAWHLTSQHKRRG